MFAKIMFTKLTTIFDCVDQHDQLINLLIAATQNQLFHFNGNLYQQTDGVAMGYHLTSLLANVFMHVFMLANVFMRVLH